MKTRLLIPGIIAILLILQSYQSNNEFVKNWPEWRGPLTTGVAPAGNPPVSWDENTNIRWKTAIPGTGFSTPIVWGRKVFVTTAIVDPDAPDSTLVPYKFNVLALNRENGEIIWEKTVAEEEVPHRIHPTASHASNSSVTDGEYLYAYFGSRGLFCMDFDGEIIWKRDFGQMEKRNNFGEGSSPAVYGNRIVILWDHEGQSEIFCLDKRDGRDIWSVDRDEPSSWSSPIIVNYDGKAQVITAASNRVRSYNLEDGKILWECSGLTGNVTPQPIYGDGILYLMSGYRGYALLAVRMAGARGDITGSDAIIWSLQKNTPYVPSPLLINGRIYFLRSNSGSVSCLDALTGNVHYEGFMLEELGTVYSSPVSAAGRIYQMGGSGLAYTIREGTEPEILSRNKLDDSFFSSPAIAGDEIFLRGQKFLYCIAEDQRH